MFCQKIDIMFRSCQLMTKHRPHRNQTAFTVRTWRTLIQEQRLAVILPWSGAPQVVDCEWGTLAPAGSLRFVRRNELQAQQEAPLSSKTSSVKTPCNLPYPALWLPKLSTSIQSADTSAFQTDRALLNYTTSVDIYLWWPARSGGYLGSRSVSVACSSLNCRCVCSVSNQAWWP